MFSGRDGVRQPYQQDEIADTYIQNRYENDPFGRALHERQVRILKKAVSPKRVRRLLEIAPGPARLTVYAAAQEFACGVEQSAAMLRVAKQRLAEFGINGWQLIRGDAFSLPFEANNFDFVMCFKLIRHFARDDRMALLAEIRRVMQPQGSLLFDVVNAPENRWLHTKWGLPGKWIDDYWFEQDAFKEEMQEAGFRVQTMYPVHPALRLQYYIWAYLYPRLPWAAHMASRSLELITTRNPLEWMACCRCE